MNRICTIMLASLAILSAGCTSYNSFGVADKDWEQLTPEQKDMVIKGYNQRKKKETETAPFRDAISVVRDGVFLHHLQ